MEKITNEMYLKLKEPLPEKAVTKHPTKTYLSSIKAVYVTERLNDVFGCGAWQIKTDKIESGEKGMVVVKVALSIPEYGVYYESFGGNDNGGEGSKNFDLGDAFKGATTDAITKIGSYMGIGISVFKGMGNTPEQKTNTETKVSESKLNEDKVIITASEYLKGCKTPDEVGSLYKSYPTLKESAVFIKMCADKKRELTPKA